MKIATSIVVATASVASAFVVPNRAATAGTALSMIGRESNVDLGGNSWKPDSEKMGSTDTGDYFPDDYDPNEVNFQDGIGGSSALLGNKDKGPALPGMENLGEDAVMMGGIEEASEIPADMEFIASSVPDAEVAMDVAASSKGAELLLSVKPVCMGFEDYYAAFDKESHKSFSVSPVAGRMDRRGGEPTELTVKCEPAGQAGTFEGNLVINLPEDNSKICYKITATSF